MAVNTNECSLSKEPTQQGMLSNNAYDLMAQPTEENQSLWRIKNNYKKDAANDKEALDFWNNIENDKRDHIKKLIELLEKRITAQ
jgi:hypothetical protein